MSEEIEFLNYIYQNAQIGKETVGHILKRGKIGQIREILEDQRIDYKKICNCARGMIERRKRKVKDISVIAQMATYMSVNFNLEEEASNEDIANLLINSSKIVISELRKKIKDNSNMSKYIINLANRLLYLEERNIDNLSKYVQKMSS